MSIKTIKHSLLSLTLALTALLGAQQASAEATYQTRIVGGTESTQGQWPWMVLLSSSSHSNGANPPPPAYPGDPAAIPGIPHFFCGATLISEQWVLTAAHCVVNDSAADVFAFVGLHDKNDTSIAATGISQIIVHPDYDDLTSDNDIALLKLATPATGAATVSFIDSSTATLLNPGNNVNVVGWGGVVAQPASTSSSLPSLSQSYPDILRDVSMPYISNTDCNAVMNGRVTDNMMCAGVPQGGVDSCQGDSGGPLVFSNDNGASWIQAGIVSWGYGCADASAYGVYTRVQSYSDWVTRAINGVTPSIRFGSWIPGKVATAQINIENSSGVDFDFTSTISSNNAAFIVSDNCQTTLIAGQSCSVDLTFSASVEGVYNGLVSYTTNSPVLSVVGVDVVATLTSEVSFNLVEADNSIQWALGGDNSWTEQQVTTDGRYSFQSGTITHNQNSSLLAYVNVAGTARDVYFDWKACSEATYDFLELWVDNKKIDARSGNAVWARKMVTLAGAGDHVIEWRYNKDYVADYGADAGWVTNITLDAASANPLPQHSTSCAPVATPEPTAPVSSGGGGAAISAWAYLVFAMPLLMRRRFNRAS
ncbi:MAG: trypsin-like serine protease [Gammaproteobacteria bacterium]|nr:trypsin-like serine protease [Gammaproteobacteria bacterium]